jgi:outer membrane protein TolC
MFYPLYNVGARINLGDLFIIPSKVRASKTEMELAEANMNARKLEIRQAVLTTYQDYLMHQELLKIQSETTENAYAAYSANEERFKNGDITLELYNQSLKSYNEERANKIVAETKYLKAKFALEALIGVPVEDVLGS